MKISEVSISVMVDEKTGKITLVGRGAESRMQTMVIDGRLVGDQATVRLLMTAIRSTLDALLPFDIPDRDLRVL